MPIKSVICLGAAVWDTILQVSELPVGALNSSLPSSCSTAVTAIFAYKWRATGSVNRCGSVRAPESAL